MKFFAEVTETDSRMEVRLITTKDGVMMMADEWQIATLLNDGRLLLHCGIADDVIKTDTQGHIKVLKES